MTDPAHIKSPRAGWQILGELELPAGAKIEDIIHARLMDILKPLNLHADFINRILKSAQEAAARTSQADGRMKFDHIHLIIFIPPEHAANESSWGFFRIEKFEQAAIGMPAAAHTLEFYLYTEGHEGEHITR